MEQLEKKPQLQPSADEICLMDDRPEFLVEVSEWDLTGDNAALVRQIDSCTLALIEESCPKNHEGPAMRAAKIIVEGSVRPKFRPEHIPSLMKAKSPTAVNKLVNAILLGKKNFDLMLIRAKMGLTL